MIRRTTLRLEALEDRLTPSVSSWQMPQVIELHVRKAGGEQPVPPAPLLQFDAAPLLGELMSAGPAAGSTALLIEGHGSTVLSDSAATPATYEGAQDDLLSLHYHYRLDDVAQEAVTLPTAAAPGSFTIKFSLTGTEHESGLGRVNEPGASTAPGRGNPGPWGITADATVSMQGSLSGTWTADAQGTSFIELQSFTVDSAIHETDSIEKQATLIGLLKEAFNLDATMHTTGQGGEFSTKHGGQLDIVASSSATDQIHGNLTTVVSPGSTAPPSPSLIDAVYTDANSSKDAAHGAVVGRRTHGALEIVVTKDVAFGMLAQSVTPPSGAPYEVTAAVDATGTARERVIPTVLLDAPVALAPSTTVFTTTPTFSWTAVAGATFYFFTIVDLTNPEIIEGTVTTNSFTPSISTLLRPGDTYSWSVQAMDGNGDASAFSNSLEFAVAFGSK